MGNTPRTESFFEWANDSAAKAPAHPMLRYEAEAVANGFTCIAGVDEAGRGPLAGPIVAAAVVLACPVDGINDSKQLSEEARETFFEQLGGGRHRIAVRVVDHTLIDRVGIQNANYMAMAEAVEQLSPRPTFLLVDGFQIRGCSVPQRHIVKGDALSQSIAAASVIAKVTRDRIMKEADTMYPEYGFARHKGYATADHLAAIEKLGPCPLHRRSFAPFAPTPQNTELFLNEVDTQ